MSPSPLRSIQGGSSSAHPTFEAGSDAAALMHEMRELILCCSSATPSGRALQHLDLDGVVSAGFAAAITSVRAAKHVLLSFVHGALIAHNMYQRIRWRLHG